MKKTAAFLAVLMVAGLAHAQGIADVSKSRATQKAVLTVSNTTSDVAWTTPNKQILNIMWNWTPGTTTATATVAVVRGTATNNILTQAITAGSDVLASWNDVWLFNGDTLRVGSEGPKNCKITYSLGK